MTTATPTRRATSPFPATLGAGTVASTIVLSSATGVQDGLPNAIKVGPGADVTVSGTVGRTSYCPGCLRQVYIGLGKNDTASTPALGPSCVYSGGTGLVLNDDGSPAGPGTAFSPIHITAPQAPGVYYVRATTTLDYFCIGAAVGPPDRSVGRIVVQASIVPNLSIYAVDPDPIPESPWDNVLTTAITKSEAGKKVLLLAKVPPGATGSIDFVGFKNAAGGDVAVVAPVCPPSGVVPTTMFAGSKCEPGEARALSPTLLDDFPSLDLVATYRNDAPLRLLDPAGGFIAPVQVNNYPVYQAGGPSPAYTLKALVAATVTLAADPNPVQMGQPFTLTATVAPLVTPPSGPMPSAIGGTVQFMQGNNPIGSPKTISNADGTVSITWTPKNCNGIGPCGAGSMGFPFDSRDDNAGAGRPTYNDVRAVFASGTSDLKGATSPDINVDVDRAPSSSVISSIGIGSGACTPAAPIYVGDTLCVTATLTGNNGYSPAGLSVELRSGGAKLSESTIARRRLCGKRQSDRCARRS